MKRVKNRDKGNNITAGILASLVLVCLLNASVLNAQTPFLKSPLSKYPNPYSAPISVVFDHHVNYNATDRIPQDLEYDVDDVNLAYTGETGNEIYGYDPNFYFPSDLEPRGYEQQSGGNFKLHGNYRYDNYYFDGHDYYGKYLYYDGHPGIDYAVGSGYVLAAASGTVIEAGWHDPNDHSYGLGQYVKISHPNDYYTLYGHLSKILVNEGVYVTEGKRIGEPGDTGDTTGIHLHFQVRKYNNTSIRYSIDPYGWEGTGVLWIDSVTSCTDTLEPNDYFGGAEGPLVSGSSYESYICSPADGDYYEITVDSPGTISLSLTVPASNDYDLELYNSLYARVEGSYNGEGLNESVGYYAESAGTYYLRVYGWRGDYSTTSSYTLTGTWPSTSQTLSVSLTANPSRGDAPLDGVDLTATVSGTATGTINYTFYCNRSDTGTNITYPNSFKIDGRNPDGTGGTVINWGIATDYSGGTSFTVYDVCDYPTAGTYTAKVIAERGTASPAEDRCTITVTEPTTEIEVTVTTEPDVEYIVVDGSSYSPPHIFTWTAGSSHDIRVPSPQYNSAGTIRYTFANWSDGGSQTHSISPSTDSTFTATFSTQYLLRTNVSPTGAGSVSGEGWYDPNTVVNLTATANSGYEFANWTGDASGTSPSTPVTMNGPKSVTANFNVTATLSYITISGSTEVNESSGAQYTCTAYYSDGSTSTVTSSASWSENSAYASISSSGYLTTSSVSSDQSFTITATYGGKSDTHSVTIKNVSAQLSYIVISGSTEVNESSGAQYTCTAYYSDGSTSTVTSSASWSENSAYASISSSGYLTTSSVPSDQSFTITATYGGKSDTHSVTIKQVSDSNFYLSFPLPNRSPSNAVINTVFDHSMSSPFCPDGVVIGYTGEEGRSEYRQSIWSVNFGCGDLYGFKNSSGSDFVLNGNYSGGGEPNYLFYDGHPGYDYRTTDQSADGRINVLAAADGIANIVFGSRYNTIYIDHENGYKSYYLHLYQQNVTDGQWVTRGQVIGISGDAGSSGAPHLHFEVSKNVNGTDVPVDPYGWTGSSPDPYTLATNVDLWESVESTLYVGADGECGGNSPCYSVIQGAIDAASSGCTVKIAQGSYAEDLTLSDAKNLTLQGGWDSTFTTQSSDTTIKSLTITNGSVTVDKVVIQ